MAQNRGDNLRDEHSIISVTDNESPTSTLFFIGSDDKIDRDNDGGDDGVVDDDDEDNDSDEKKEEEEDEEDPFPLRACLNETMKTCKQRER